MKYLYIPAFFPLFGVAFFAVLDYIKTKTPQENVVCNCYWSAIANIALLTQCQYKIDPFTQCNGEVATLA